MQHGRAVSTTMIQFSSVLSRQCAGGQQGTADPEPDLEPDLEPRVSMPKHWLPWHSIGQK